MENALDKAVYGLLLMGLQGIEEGKTPDENICLAFAANGGAGRPERSGRIPLKIADGH